MLDTLQSAGILIAHEAADLAEAAEPAAAHAVIRPEPLDFVSYPYEWSFGMLRDAALLTLRAQAIAAAQGFTLRDATAYNVQFCRGRPILIDTLSFERATPGEPWIAYRQFCEHFLAPLGLMAHRDIRLGLMLRDHVDGIPLDLAATLLPATTKLNLGLGAHVHAHARAQRRFAGDGAEAASSARRATVSPLRQRALIDSLERTVAKLDWEPAGTEWADYADNTSYGDAATSAKERLVRDFLRAAGGEVVWDMGANTGRYSRIAAELGRRVIAWDVDPAATERHYRALRSQPADGPQILPLLLDLANPSPGLGWAGEERRPVADRSNADVVLALALVHHLAIGRNVPLEAIATYFARLAPNLVIEWVPKEDAMVRTLLATREDVFAGYSVEGFEAAFGGAWTIADRSPIEGTARTLFRLVRRG